MHRLFFRLLPLVAAALLATACGGETVVRERVDDSAEAGATNSTDAAENDAEDTTAPADSGATESTTADEDASDSAPDEADAPDDEPVDATESTDEADDASAAATAESDGGAIDDGLITDDQLTSLAEDCTQGSDVACDILWQATELGTPEDEIALDCGGRGPRDGFFCTPEIIAVPGESWFADDSPGIDAIGDDCRNGDMTACDFLYFRSAIDSPWEELGNTCADRIEVAFPDCRTVFGPTAE